MRVISPPSCRGDNRAVQSLARIISDLPLYWARLPREIEMAFTQRAVLMAYAAILLAGTPAYAQVDFSGQWESLYHEDGPERLPGPELADYPGLPLNDAARLHADSWDADRISVVQEYQCRPHGGDYSMHGLSTLRVWREIDPATQRLRRLPHTHAMHGHGADHLDGRPPASAGVCRSTPGRVSRPAAGKATRSWSPPRTSSRTTCGATVCLAAITPSSRSGSAARQLPDGHQRAGRSGVPDRAAGAQRELGSGSRPAHESGVLRAGAGSPEADGDGAASPARQQRIPDRGGRLVRPAAGGDPGRPGDHVSGISQDPG